MTAKYLGWLFVCESAHVRLFSVKQRFKKKCHMSSILFSHLAKNKQENGLKNNFKKLGII